MLYGRSQVLAGDQITAQPNQANYSLEFNQVNFNQLISEVLRLRRQRTFDLIKLNEQSDELIQCYTKINVYENNPSPLRIAG